ncbi:hypothetical protein [Nostoc cycadae]|uniref:Alpha/beta hydrolase n=1 Tax=Nostoc cycadae WK-1 TaxID=1861711 RepID=A0A2H6LF52_9NOSO|nr:hypothetical protein [Nostoc cycadae]GBE91842.1 hypothetical protein NCWK1_1595 [Nostoc cycadae WK-1]
MATDYVLFIHGVTIRNPNYADELFQRLAQSASDRNFHNIPFYWGDINQQPETKLLGQLRSSSDWNQMWFHNIREQQILPFTGDAALYISRYVGAKIVRKLKKQIADSGLLKAKPDDRLHIVTHSWGTVMLFDILFASRWEDQNAPAHDDVMAIRDAIFGVDGENRDRYQGIKIASIHTMGSPVAIFSLTDVKSDQDETGASSSHDITPNLQTFVGQNEIGASSSHDITPKLQTLLKSLQEEASPREKLPWWNYIHPADPIAYPLQKMMIDLVDGYTEYLDIQDTITHSTGWLGWLENLIAQTPLAQTNLPLLLSLLPDNPHGSYWHNDEVIKKIIHVVKNKTPKANSLSRSV